MKTLDTLIPNPSLSIYIRDSQPSRLAIQYAIVALRTRQSRAPFQKTTAKIKNKEYTLVCTKVDCRMPSLPYG